MKRIILIPFIMFILFMSGGKSVGVNQLKLYKEIEHLKQQGVTARFIDNETVELKQDWSGFQRIKSLKEPDEVAIRAWIAADSIPLLEIDPALIDTNLYTGWYNYWTTVSLSNGISVPPLAGDVDHNGRMEVYGIYKDTTSYDFESRIYEVDTSGLVTFRYKYTPRRSGGMQITDIDNNGLQEVFFLYSDSTIINEQVNYNSLPTKKKLVYAKYQSAGAILTNEKVTELDNDSLVDFIYRGSPPDSIFAGYMTFVAEYDPVIQNFKPVWSTILWPPNHEAAIGGYDVGDYDGDGWMNFLASGMGGQVWVGEAIGDNQYTISWKDSLPGFINLLYQTSGDVDDDGKREFFVGATMGSGNWTIVYEADSNDNYSPKFAFHLLSGGSLDEPVYLTNDVDGDGKLELVILSGGQLYIFKGTSDNYYSLWYFQRNIGGDGIQFYDFNGDGRKDFIISRNYVNGQGFLGLYAEIYKASGTTDVVIEPTSNRFPTSFQLFQNFPNPFNPVTMIRFDIPQDAIIDLSVYDLLGKKIATLLHGEKQPGRYTLRWDGSGLPSGIYIYRFNANGTTNTKKMILMK